MKIGKCRKGYLDTDEAGEDVVDGDCSDLAEVGADEGDPGSRLDEGDGVDDRVTDTKEDAPLDEGDEDNVEETVEASLTND